MKVYTKKEINKKMKGIERVKGKGKKTESFKQIIVDGYPTKYIISSYGRVFSIDYMHTKKLKKLKLTYDKNGYTRVTISVNNKQKTAKVHRLVASHFIKNKDPKNKTPVNHKHSIKDFNVYWNLEWVSGSENIVHSLKHGLRVPIKGEKVYSSIYTDEQIIQVCEMLKMNKSFDDIERETGVTNYLISHIKSHKRWKHISKNYDFSDYHFGKDVDTIRKICSLLEENKLTQTEIAKETGVDSRLVYSILTGHSNKDISKDYDFSNYDKTKSKIFKNQNKKRRRVK